MLALQGGIHPTEIPCSEAVLHKKISYYNQSESQNKSDTFENLDSIKNSFSGFTSMGSSSYEKTNLNFLNNSSIVSSNMQSILEFPYRSSIFHLQTHKT